MALKIYPRAKPYLNFTSARNGQDWLTKKKFGVRIFISDRARWGASGALLLTIRYSEVEFLAEADNFFWSVLMQVVLKVRALCKALFVNPVRTGR